MTDQAHWEQISSPCVDVIVHSMYPVGREEPVLYCSLARDTENCKQLLVSALWKRLLATGSPGWDHCRSSDPDRLPIRVVYGPLGNPRLMVGESRGPALSFSETGGRAWAALSGDDSDLGIDVAGPQEFVGDYPVRRVFNPEELQHALRLRGGDQAAACALLWSVKEAFVKALGCGFHFVDPLQVRVSPAAGERAVRDGGYLFHVELSAKNRLGFAPSASRHESVHARPLSQMWLSIAHLNRSPEVHE